MSSVLYGSKGSGKGANGAGVIAREEKGVCLQADFATVRTDVNDWRDGV
jgi:hypothetical protein